ncbi:MAG TPA: BTAD domain-containing putative transcriptional regulator [Patescibacteria group bacterium]|nr:BTAD domain-containing putative transcriptional regulator [Patescibacteria group bacterium]
MEGAPGPGVDFRVLGPVEARRDDVALPLGGPRQRTLLALLLLESGRPVTVDRLIHELWAGEPGNGAETTLRSYVSRLRTALGAASAIRATAAGYALDAAPELVDARRFETLVREADAALSRRNPRRARELLADALLLWRGRPYGDMATEGALRVEAERLEELRQHAAERRVEADLELGLAGELLDELEAAVRQHPFRERLWHHLMLALYRAGRQADALAAYHRARAALDEQLGIEPGPELQALETAILRHDVPPPPAKAAGLGRQSMPAPASRFVGRERELAELDGQIQAHRLVTLTGVGGVGKTRLALEVARRAGQRFAEGAAFVDLAPIADPELVVRQVAATLGVREQGEEDITDLVSASLRGTEMLLVIDNCEHVRGATAQLVDRLLKEAAAVQVLATSREPLGLDGEVDVAVQPLAVAGAAAGPPAEAIVLFLDRASAARPGLGGDERTLAVATRICTDLEGLPLAIELAAARAKSLTLDDIAARLDDRFRFLVSWRRLTAARHRTLREAMDWSYELLTDAERSVLRRMSIFAGGFSLDAVAVVCAVGDEDGALLVVDRLVDASLVISDEAPGETRYRLLETVRQYAGRRAAEAGEDEGLRSAHAAWCLELAEAAAGELSGERQGSWFVRLEAEHNNLRAALANLDASGDTRQLLRLAIALTRFWYVRGYLSEGRMWLERALDADAEREPTLRRRALTAVASLALLQGDYPVATRFAEQSLDVARATGETRFEANALSNLGAIVLAGGDVPRAATLLEDAVRVGRTAGDERILALAVNNLGDLELTRGEYERARPLFEESLGLLRARGDTANVARALFNLGACELQLGGDEMAEAYFKEGLGLARDAGDQEDLAWLLEGLAALAASRGRGERAGMILGAASALLEAMGADYKPFERRLREGTEQATVALLGEAALAAAITRGRELALGDVVELALTGGD